MLPTSCDAAYHAHAFTGGSVHGLVSRTRPAQGVGRRSSTRPRTCRSTAPLSFAPSIASARCRQLPQDPRQRVDERGASRPWRRTRRTCLQRARLEEAAGDVVQGLQICRAHHGERGGHCGRRTLGRRHRWQGRRGSRGGPRARTSARTCARSRVRPRVRPRALLRPRTRARPRREAARENARDTRRDFACKVARYRARSRVAARARDRVAYRARDRARKRRDPASRLAGIPARLTYPPRLTLCVTPS